MDILGKISVFANENEKEVGIPLLRNFLVASLV
jgi:hypothetical protein